LRGVSLLGINSIELPNALRDRIWTRLATDLKPQGLEKIIHQEISFDQLPEALSSHLSSDAAGRTLVRIGHGSGR
jgi:acrylyl-CoA reductase (NADPH)